MSDPSWWRPNDEAPPVYFIDQAKVPAGWQFVPGRYDFATGQWIDPDPLDHDGDGKKGGSIAAPGDPKVLRAEYLAQFGKKPFNGWDEATLRSKIAG